MKVYSLIDNFRLMIFYACKDALCLEAQRDFLSVHLIYLNLCSQTLDNVLINFGIVRGNILLLKIFDFAPLRYGLSKHCAISHRGTYVAFVGLSHIIANYFSCILLMSMSLISST